MVVLVEKEGVKDSNEKLAKELADIITTPSQSQLLIILTLPRLSLRKIKLQPLSTNMSVIWKDF